MIQAPGHVGSIKVDLPPTTNLFGKGSRWQVAPAAGWTTLIIRLPPLLDHDLCLRSVDEQPAIQTFTAKCPFETLKAFSRVLIQHGQDSQFLAALGVCFQDFVLDGREPVLPFCHFPKPMVDMVRKMLPMMKLMKLVFAAGIPALRVSGMALDERVPRPVAEIDRAVRAANARHFAAQLREFEVIVSNQNPPVKSVGSIPLIVLSHGKPQPMPNFPDDINAAYEQTWQELQVEQAELSPNSHRIIAQASGHDIQLEQPELVIESVRQVLAAVQQAVMLEEAV